MHTHIAPKEIDDAIANKLKPNKSQLNKTTIIESVPPHQNEIDIDDLHSTSSDTSSQLRETQSTLKINLPIDDEKLMRQLLDKAAAYYNTSTAISPTQHAILFPAQKICIMYNKQPIVSHLDFFAEIGTKGRKRRIF